MSRRNTALSEVDSGSRLQKGLACLSVLAFLAQIFQIFYLQTIAPELSGTHANHTPKGTCKVVLMLEPDAHAYVKHTEFRIAQQFLGTLDALVENILMRAEPGALSE
jgi:hypothetical protein